MRKKIVALALTALCCLLLVSVAMAEGSIVPKEETLIVAVGKTQRARCTVTPQNTSLSYESSDESIATVDYQGTVQGKALGECTVTITSKRDPSVTATVVVRVIQPVKSVKATVETTKLPVGGTVQVEYTLAPENATLPEVNFLSQNEKVATVDANGLVTAVARGTANIVVNSADGNARSTIRITVEQLPQSVKFKKEEYNVVAGKFLKFMATVQPDDTNNKKLIWSSSDETIAKVDQTGKVTTKAVGDVTITATCAADESIFGSVELHSVHPVQSVSFEQAVYDTSVGGVIQLKPIIKPADASHPRLRYEVRNRQVCTVDENGVITTTHGGITTVTATTTDGSERSATVTVRSIVPVQGVSFDEKSVRVGMGDHTFVYAVVLPVDATVKDMTWVSSDPAIASVSGTDNRARITGHSWGRCTITGTTEQGGYSASIEVNVGALRSPLTLRDVTTVDGQRCAIVYNESDMHITQITLSVRAGGVKQEMDYAVDLAPQQEIQLPVEGGSNVSAAVYAYETDTGFYNNAGRLLYSYRISPGLQVWKK